MAIFNKMESFLFFKILDNAFFERNIKKYTVKNHYVRIAMTILYKYT